MTDQRRPTAVEVVRATSRVVHVPSTRLREPSRVRKVAEARKAIFRVLRDESGLTWDEISRFMFNGQSVGGTPRRGAENADLALVLAIIMQLQDTRSADRG